MLIDINIKNKLKMVKIIVISPKTNKELENNGFKVNIIPEKYSSKGIVKIIKHLDPKNKFIVAFRSDK